MGFSLHLALLLLMLMFFSDFGMDSLDELMTMAEEDKAWDEIVTASFGALHLGNPLSNAFLTVFHDSLPLPTPKFASSAALRYAGYFDPSPASVTERRNVLVT